MQLIYLKIQYLLNFNVKLENIFAIENIDWKNRKYYEFILGNFGKSLQIKDEFDVLKSDIYSLGICIGLVMGIMKNDNETLDSISEKFVNINNLDKLLEKPDNVMMKGMVYLMTHKNDQNIPSASELLDFITKIQ
eukprot:NODE_653_length_4981_cov_0.275092.p5 type:complete len:135 gc:universal NODE_653_length_4981_cov_0.275092:3218-3622(+)